MVEGGGGVAGGDAASCTPPDLLKDVSPSTVAPGGTVAHAAYTVDDQTAGLGAGPGGGVTGILPDDSAPHASPAAVTVTGSKFNWSSAIGNTNRADDTLTLQGMTIPSGGRAVVTAVVQVSPTAASGAVTNQAELTGLPAVFAKTLSDYPPTGAIDDPTPLVVQSFDRGDAPASFGTTQAQNGPSHELAGYDAAAHLAPLMLGTTVDGESDGVPTADATGDDTADIDDEDGLGGPLSLTVGTAPTVSVSLTNNSNQVATLAGWIDLDRDGTFEAGERTTASIPANAGAATRNLTFPAPTVEGASYARFRLLPGDVADPQPTGAATAGEVEDYALTIEPAGAVITCDTSAALFNTAYNGTGGKLPAGSRDLNWQSGVGTPAGPGSVTSWIPAWVVTPVAGFWARIRTAMRTGSPTGATPCTTRRERRCVLPLPVPHRAGGLA